MSRDAQHSPPLWLHLFLWMATAALLVVVFHLLGNTVGGGYGRSVFRWMIARWNDRVSFGADYSIGYFIPVISLGLIIHNRRQLLEATGGVNLWGLPLVAGLLLLHWIGARAQQPRISLAALVGLLWALPLLCYGWRLARQLIFPCGYLLFCIPWNFLDALTFPLRLFSTAAAAGLLNGLGIGVERSGTIIRALGENGLDFNVADPCSGLSSMLAMLALTALFAHLSQPDPWRKALLFACAVPLAMAGNLFRIVTIAIVAKTLNRDLALTLYHDYSAFLVFPVAILLMLGIASFLRSFTWSKARTWIGTSSPSS